MITTTFLNIFYFIFASTILCTLFFSVINIAMLLLIAHRLLNLNNQISKSVKIDELYRNFLVKYSNIYNMNFPMVAMLLVKLHNICSFNQFSICSTLIIFILYLLSIESFIKVIFNIWIAILNLYNVIEGDPNIFNKSVDGNIPKADTLDMKGSDNVINIFNKDTIHLQETTRNVGEASFKNESKQNNFTAGNISPTDIKFNPLLTRINKMNIALMRTRGIIPQKGLIFNTNPLSSVNLIRAFSTANSIKQNLNNIPTPNIGKTKSVSINTGKNVTNSIFKGYKSHKIIKDTFTRVGAKGSLMSAANQFENDKLINLFKKYGAVSVQMTINTKANKDFPNGKWSSITPFYTLSENNLKQWKVNLSMSINLHMQHYNSLFNEGNVNVIFKYKPITNKDNTLAAIGHLWSPTVFNEINPTHNSEILDSNINDFYLTHWAKLVPTVWNWSDLSDIKIVFPHSPTKFYVENLLIKNPFKDIVNGPINLTIDQLDELKTEFQKISKVNPNIIKENPDFINITLEVKDGKDGLRLCTIFYGDLLITRFQDKDLGEYLTPNGIVHGFDRAFLNGTVLRIEDNSIKYNTIQNNSKKDLYMGNTPKAYWKDIINTEFATYDFETRFCNLKKTGADEKRLEVISFALYHNTMWSNNEMPTTRFNILNDNINNQDLLLKKFLVEVKTLAEKSLLKLNKNSDRIFYLFAHNAARFDEVFLIKTLIENLGKNDEFKVIRKDNIMISMDWVINGKLSDKELKKMNLKITKIKFMDTYLMLPSSLKKLAISFSVENKGDFNVKDINEDTDLKSIMPQLREYNIQDCRILWNILAIHCKNSTLKFGVDIFTCPTASSFAFKVFRTKYLKPEEHKISITDLDTYEYLKDAYHGGANDVYHPSNMDGDIIHYYDVNSEYPAMMAQNTLPTGKAIKIIGDVAWQDPSFTGFVLADIKCPIDIPVPLLALKVGGKTVAGSGCWRGIYYAAELREALRLGYEIKAIEALKYEGRLVFDEFIKDIYKERQSYPKTNPLNMICKLIMNSTYGRFGMSPLLSKVRILDINDNYDYKENTIFTDIIEISDDKVMVVTKDHRNIELNFDKPDQNLQISLPIAAAITAHARIHIHRIKMLAASTNSLLYSDTDSVATTKPLPESIIGNNLGQLKLECTADKGVFLSSKFYALHDVKDGVNGDTLPDIIKAKGLKDNTIINFESFIELLDINKYISTNQFKWFREIESSTIFIRDMPNTLRITTGKRVLLVNTNNKFIGTRNVVFQDGKVISREIEMIGLPTLWIIQLSNLPMLYKTPLNKVPVLFKAQSKLPNLYIVKSSLPPIIKIYPQVIINPVSLVLYSGGNPIIPYVGNTIIIYKSLDIPPVPPIIHLASGIWAKWLQLYNTRPRSVIYMYPPGTTIDEKTLRISNRYYFSYCTEEFPNEWPNLGPPTRLSAGAMFAWEWPEYHRKMMERIRKNPPFR